MPSEIKLDVHDHAKPSTAYAAAFEAATAELLNIEQVIFGDRVESSEATWLDAEHMTRVALWLREFRDIPR